MPSTSAEGLPIPERAQAIADVKAATGDVRAYIDRLLDSAVEDEQLPGWGRAGLINLRSDLVRFDTLIDRPDATPEFLRWESERLLEHAETYQEENPESPEAAGLVERVKVVPTAAASLSSLASGVVLAADKL